MRSRSLRRPHLRLPRSHGEILAKAFSAIRQLSDARLMKSWKPLAAAHPSRVEKGYSGSVRLALRFFVYGAYSELFARRRNQTAPGGSCTLFHALSASIHNAIVALGSIAPGAALFKRVIASPACGLQHRTPLSPAVPCGRHHFSAMDQYRSCGSRIGRPALLFNCMKTS